MLINGDTIRLTFNFVDFDDAKLSVNNVTMNVYDNKHAKIVGPINLDVNIVSQGVYQVKYTIPEGTGPIIFEAVGIGLDNFPYKAQITEERNWKED